MDFLYTYARKRSDKHAAIHWYDEAYKAAKGPATRLQWGVSYLKGLLDLAPEDEPRIEKVVKSIFGELPGIQNTFYERKN